MTEPQAERWLGHNHNHSWDHHETELGPTVQDGPGCWSAHLTHYYVCRCGAFMVSLSGPEHVKIVGRFPDPCPNRLAFMRRFVPLDRHPPIEDEVEIEYR